MVVAAERKMLRIKHWQNKGDIIAFGICKCCGHRINVREKDFSIKENNIVVAEDKLLNCNGCGAIEAGKSWIFLSKEKIFGSFIIDHLNNHVKSINKNKETLKQSKNKKLLGLSQLYEFMDGSLILFKCRMCNENYVVSKEDEIAKCTTCGHIYKVEIKDGRNNSSGRDSTKRDEQKFRSAVNNLHGGQP